MTLVKAVGVVLVAVGAVGLAAAADAVKVEPKDFKWKAKFDGGDQLGGHDEGENRFFLYSFGTATAEVTVPEDGEYTITVDASCTKAKGEYAKFKLTVGDAVVAKEAALKAEEAKPYTFTAKLKKGKQKLEVEFLNDEFKEGEYDSNLFLHGAKLEKKK